MENPCYLGMPNSQNRKTNQKPPEISNLLKAQNSKIRPVSCILSSVSHPFTVVLVKKCGFFKNFKTKGHKNTKKYPKTPIFLMSWFSCLIFLSLYLLHFCSYALFHGTLMPLCSYALPLIPLSSYPLIPLYPCCASTYVNFPQKGTK